MGGATGLCRGRSNEDVATSAHRAFATPSQLESPVQHLCNGNRADYHLALAIPTGVICSMCNITALYVETNSTPLAISDEAAHVYINSVKDDDWGVFPLHVALTRSASNAVDR